MKEICFKIIQFYAVRYINHTFSVTIDVLIYVFHEGPVMCRDYHVKTHGCWHLGPGSRQNTLQWHHMSITACQITDDSTVS